MNCQNCGRVASRRRRSLFRKIFSRASFQCEHCGWRGDYYRPFVTAFQPWAACPLCCNMDLAARRSVDPVDKMSRNLLRNVLLVGFPVYHCSFCRYQFRDWRKLYPRPASAFSDDIQRLESTLRSVPPVQDTKTLPERCPDGCSSIASGPEAPAVWTSPHPHSDSARNEIRVAVSDRD
jgi:hypothetical protein